MDLTLVTATSRVEPLLRAQQGWSVLSSEQNLGMGKEILGCPDIRTPLSALPLWSKGMHGMTFGNGWAAGVAGKLMVFINWPS